MRDRFVYVGLVVLVVGIAVGTVSATKVNLNETALFQGYESYDFIITVEEGGYVTVTAAEGDVTIPEGETDTVHAYRWLHDLEAHPKSGYEFVRWKGEYASPFNYRDDIYLRGDSSTTAVFKQPKYEVEVTTTPVNGGTVKVTPNNIVNKNEDVTVEAVPNSGYTFDGWIGDIISDENPLTIESIDSDTELQAEFSYTGSEKTHSITVTVDGEGTVKPTSGEFPEGTEVQISAEPEEDWVFSRYEEDFESSSSTSTVVMDSDKDITAVFEQDVFGEYDVATEVDPPEGGTVTLTPDSPYESGTEVTVSATPSEGYRFVSYSGSISSEEKTTTFTVSGRYMSIRANFEEIPPVASSFGYWETSFYLSIVMIVVGVGVIIWRFEENSNL